MTTAGGGPIWSGDWLEDERSSEDDVGGLYFMATFLWLSYLLPEVFPCEENDYILTIYNLQASTGLDRAKNMSTGS